MGEAARKKRPWAERFQMGLGGELPDRSVPGFLRDAQLALAAPAESVRRGVGDFLSADSLPGDYMVPGGPAVGAMIRKQLGGWVKDPVRAGMEMTGYPAARRSIDAGRLALETQDPVEAAGRATRAVGEGGLALAQVAGNAYGVGSNVTKLYRGKTPVAELPDPELAALQSRVAKAQTAGPTQLEELIRESGKRAAEADAKIRPVFPETRRPAPPAQAAPPRLGLDIDPARKAELNAQLERLALAAEDAGQAGDVGKVGRAHTAIDDVMMQAKREAATAQRANNPRLKEIRARLDEIAQEKRTVAGAWREEELDDEIAALMNERRQILGKAPKEGQGVTLSANGAPGVSPKYGGKSLKKMVADGEFKSVGAAHRAMKRAEKTGDPKAYRPESMIRQGELVDRDAVAKALNDIYEANGYTLPRNYATQIAKQLERNPQSIRRTIFNMRMEGDPRVLEVGRYDSILAGARKMALPLAMTGGQAYVADRYGREHGYKMGLQ